MGCKRSQQCFWRQIDPGVASSIPARSHTFVEIDHEIISTADSKRVVVSYKYKYVHDVLVKPLVQLAQEKMWSRHWLYWHDHSCWLRRKELNQTNQNISLWDHLFVNKYSILLNFKQIYLLRIFFAWFFLLCLLSGASCIVALNQSELVIGVHIPLFKLFKLF